MNSPLRQPRCHTTYHQTSLQIVKISVPLSISYRKDMQDSHMYSAGLDRPDIKMAMQISKIISNADYKKGQGVMNKEPAVIGRPDFEHAVEASKLSSQASLNQITQSTEGYSSNQFNNDCERPFQLIRINEILLEFIKQREYRKIKYKEKFDNEMKDKKHHYNPLESASFRQSQLANALASNVKYKKDIQTMHDPVSDLPDLFLDHALKASKMLSGREYRKLFEENKGMYHFDADAAEHLHHKGNATLQSQVKYKEEYEKNKGKCMLEFVETPSYQASKEAQKMQSEKVYREDFEKEIKGRSSLDLDKTPEFLHVKYITNLLKEKEYKKDLENEIKGKGMELNSEVLDIQRAKRASEMASEKEYKKDLESQIKGKGMQVGADTLGIQHAIKASEMASEKDYKRDLETEIKGKGMQVSTDTPDIQRAKKASEMASQKEYKKDLENEIKGKGMQVSMDIPDMLRAKRASEIYSQKKYKDEAEKMLSNYSPVADSPEIQRIKTTQQNVSAVFYKKEVGAGIAVKDTPEIERVKKNQQNISSVKYKEEMKCATAISDPPELKRIKENQKNISNLQYKEQCPRATPLSVTPEIERVKYKGEMKQATPISDPPELKRVKENQKNISNVYYKGQLGRATALSVTPEMERVKYTQDHKQMKGRPSLILDTPALRHVKEAQNHISMVKYHEDFEKTKGRGFTPVVDDPVTERVRKNTQIVSDAAYKGVHPHIVEMDRRPGIIVDLKVWRTDPGSIFDIDPLEDNIQSRSLHMLSGIAYKRRVTIGDTGLDLIRAVLLVQVWEMTNQKYPRFTLAFPAAVRQQDRLMKEIRLLYDEMCSLPERCLSYWVVSLLLRWRMWRCGSALDRCAFQASALLVLLCFCHLSVYPSQFELVFSFASTYRTWECDGEGKKQMHFSKEKSSGFQPPELIGKKRRFDHQEGYKCGYSICIKGENWTSFINCNVVYVFVKPPKNFSSSIFIFCFVIFMSAYFFILVLSPSIQNNKKVMSVPLFKLAFAFKETEILSTCLRKVHCLCQGTSGSDLVRTYRAMYDYSAQDEDEVSFRDGDYIVNVQPIDDGWMYGTVQRTGKTGMLPANYIEFVN
ncbi:hypothetical protein HPG69_012443 [Diceros bicornis minor]|uniref:SH3 domain-containing protein n=1 Tax=Diceros bicornis minor TaxID=77932 RepID=A0A7J7FLP1_DICBM|nr:hypothetical protein HPG69_012443 [Diceros bicornis minor]